MGTDLSFNKEVLAVLFKKWDRQPLSATEQALLDDWLAESPSNEEALIAFEQENWADAELKNWERTNAEEIWNRSRTDMPAKPVHRVHFRYRWWAAAAVVLVLLSVAVYRWALQKQPEEIVIAKTEHKQTQIQPGKDGAVLTLADGQQIVLDSAQNGEISKQYGSSVVLQDGKLIYNPTGNSTGEIAYNLMSTPKGRQFNMTLSDGTRVWLNAASSIRYPTIFAGKQRTVEITGEAYFEVAKNAEMPFHVRINKGSEIEVLGTQFNVNAYDNERTMKTTLLQGSVKVTANGNNVVLKPGQQAQSAASIKVLNNIDTDKIMAWKNGLFNFEGAKLEEVMNQLERWYDIEVEYEKGVPDIYFEGGMSKNIQLSDLLTILEKSKVHFRVEGRKLIVLP